MISNNQVGHVTKIRGKKAIVQVGAIPITVNIEDLVVVIDKE
jgi:DNA mismatch repair protein MutS2